MPINSKPSLRYELALDGAVRVYPDKREVCTDTRAGRLEYKARTEIMRMRQHNICGRGAHIIQDPTFDHANTRGMGGSKRDDRVWDENGNPLNVCSCLGCNSDAGSRRL